MTRTRLAAIATVSAALTALLFTAAPLASSTLVVWFDNHPGTARAVPVLIPIVLCLIAIANHRRLTRSTLKPVPVSRQNDC